MQVRPSSRASPSTRSARLSASPLVPKCLSGLGKCAQTSFWLLHPSNWVAEKSTWAYSSKRQCFRRATAKRTTRPLCSHLHPRFSNRFHGIPARINKVNTQGRYKELRHIQGRWKVRCRHRIRSVRRLGFC